MKKSTAAVKLQPRRLHFNREGVFLQLFFVGGRPRSSAVDRQTADSAVLAVAYKDNEQPRRSLAVARRSLAVAGGCRRLSAVVGGC